MLKKLRFHNRKSVDELIRPILNLDLVEMFSHGERPVFEPIPLKFTSFVEPEYLTKLLTLSPLS